MDMFVQYVEATIYKVGVGVLLLCFKNAEYNANLAVSGFKEKV
jgi:hypothetical protein